MFHVFAPHSYPGVGMGSVLTVAGLGGLVALAVTSGMLVAEGLGGAVVYSVAAVAVLAAHRHDGLAGIQPVAFPVIAAVLALAAAHSAVVWRSRRRDAPAARSDADAAAGAPRRSRRALDAVAALLAGGAVGYVWSEWEHRNFGFDRQDALAIVVAAAAAALGAYAARLFIGGALQGGGSTPIVGATAVIGALLLNAAGFYIPFAGYVVLAITALFAVRLRRRGSRKYKGLRILS